ncbi:prepilin-type N-terminal cleavage/methylation domain-containing protein [Candidatus Peregrinibacteria bacterium]|nr:prepilin-type N-terminal cleavage/methylation domain-containing protein [Candidatus Peregrinibacteria bacterium]
MSLANKTMNKTIKKKNHGFSLIEVLLAITLFTAFTAGVFALALDTLQRDSSDKLKNEALSYAEEGLEAARNIRDKNFLLLTNGDHGLQFLNDNWIFIAAPEIINDFYERTIFIEDVYRDSNGNIADNGSYDPETKKIKSEIVWYEKGFIPKSVSLSSYFTDWTGDDWIQTTCVEFNAGTFENTETEITVAPPTDNCAIKLGLIEEQSDVLVSANIGEHARDIFVEGNYAYAATNKTQEGLTIIDISNPQNPSIIKNLDLGGKGKYVTKSGNYLYMGVEKSTKGLAIIDVSNPANAYVVKSLNVGAEGNQPDVVGNYVYMGIDSENSGFKIINVTNKSNPSVTSSLNVEGEVNTVRVVGSYAYIGTDKDQKGFRVINISNPQSPSIVATLNVGDDVNAMEINGPFAFIGTEESENQNTLQVINIASPTQPSIITSLNVGQEIQDLVAYGDYLYAAIDDNHAGLAAINISNPTQPTLAYTMDVMGKATGIDTDGSYIYITTDVNNHGVVIVGTTVTGTAESGIFTGTAFDTGSEDTRYNFIAWDSTQVPGGSVTFQIRTASTLQGLNNATWVGNDGTGSTFYTISRTPIVLDLNRSGSRYAQFKMYIESDGTTSPQVENVRINYTP